MGTDHRTLGETLFDEDIAVEEICWLASATVRRLPEEISDTLFDVRAGAIKAHESLAPFTAIPDYVEDEDQLSEWIAEQQIEGFLVRMATPVPIRFSDDDETFTSLGFGYSMSILVLVREVADAVPLGIAWKNARIEELRRKAKEKETS